jgi:hypothetical protein
MCSVVGYIGKQYSRKFVIEGLARLEKVFQKAGLSLFPEKLKDLKTDCSCPDWSNPVSISLLSTICWVKSSTVIPSQAILSSSPSFRPRRRH